MKSEKGIFCRDALNNNLEPRTNMNIKPNQNKFQSDSRRGLLELFAPEVKQ